MENWLVVLVIALAANMMMRWQIWRETRGIERKASKVLSILIVWAETWGDDPASVRAKLAEALKR